MVKKLGVQPTASDQEELAVAVGTLETAEDLATVEAAQHQIRTSPAVTCIEDLERLNDEPGAFVIPE